MLSEDQRALLRLLAQREEGYEDIAALMGIGVAEVRARVKDALEELKEEGEAPGDAPAAAIAEPPTSPEPPSPPAGRPESAAAARPSPPHEGSSWARPPAGRRRLAELAGGALVVLLLVLFATGALDLGGDDDSDSDGRTAAAAGSSRLTQAVLEPVGDSEARGRVVFGRVGKNPVLQIQAEGLDPSPAGSSYTVWLYRSPKVVLRVGAARVGDSGELAAQLPIPLELLGFVANGAFPEIRVSLTDDAAYKAEVARAEAQNRLPPYRGETVLRGEIVGPRLEAP